jgi:hypothetical protein
MHPRFYAVSRRELARHAGVAEDSEAAGEEATAQGSGER